jgi:hypothetical protein
LTPATDRQIAEEMDKLKSIFGYEASAWLTAFPLYLDALGDIPLDLLQQAVTRLIRLAGPDDFFPKPGQIRALVAEELSLRQDAVKRLNAPADDPGWPDWLAKLWGPAPEGPRERRKFLEANQERYAEARAWREAGEPVLPLGITVAKWRSMGSPDAIGGVPVTRRAIDKVKNNVNPISEFLKEHGVTATETWTPSLRPEQEAGDG